MQKLKQNSYVRGNSYIIKMHWEAWKLYFVETEYTKQTKDLLEIDCSLKSKYFLATKPF